MLTFIRNISKINEMSLVLLLQKYSCQNQLISSQRSGKSKVDFFEETQKAHEIILYSLQAKKIQ